MGYTTDFSGKFDVTPTLKPEHSAYLTAFNGTRRMKRDASKLVDVPDPVRVAAKLDVGVDGAYFVGSTKNFGQDSTPDILNYNAPPSGQPGLWCQWTPNEDGTAIVWDGGEKFYEYTEWIEYLIEHFLKPWGYKVNGEVLWYGEDSDDRGKIVARNNRVTTKRGHTVYR